MRSKLLITLGVVILSLTAWMFHRTTFEIGRVLNSQGDGKLYNGESFYNYIHYPDKCNRDDVVLTICLLNPLNNYCDDVLLRGDVVLLHDTPAASEN